LYLYYNRILLGLKRYCKSSNNQNDNGNDNDNDGPSGLKILVHLNKENVGNIEPLNVFIITSNGECAIANISSSPAGFTGQEIQLTFEFDSGIIDEEENSMCVLKLLPTLNLPVYWGQ
jgi:hypothetical protein